MFNFLGNIINSILLLALIILVADIVIRRILRQKQMDVSNIPAGPIVQEASAIITALFKKLIPLENENAVRAAAIIVIFALLCLVKVFFIR